MKLLILSPLSLEIGGGGEQDVLDLTQELTARGVEVTVVHLGVMYRSVKRISDDELARRLGQARLISLPPLALAKTIIPLPSVRAMRELSRLFRESDLVLFAVYYGSDLVIQLLARMNGVPLVGSQANALQRYDRVLARDVLQLLYNRTVGLMLLRRSDGVRVWNRDDQAWLAARGQPSTFVLYPTANLPGPSPSPAEGPSSEAVDPSRLTVLVAGRMTPQKGVDVIEGIVKGILEGGPEPAGHYKFVFVGTPQLPGGLEALSAAHPDLVVNLGIQPRTDLVRLMGQVDLLLMPSRYESFGMVAMEAQGQGTPLLGSNIVGLRDVAVDGETGFLVDGWDPKLYIERLEKVREIKRTDPARWAGIRRASVARYQELFSPARHAEQMDRFVEFLAGIIARKRARGPSGPKGASGPGPAGTSPGARR